MFKECEEKDCVLFTRAFYKYSVFIMCREKMNIRKYSSDEEKVNRAKCVIVK